MLSAVIFDMDGVIVDSEPLHRRAYHSMFQKIGISVSEDLYHSLTGKSTLNLCKELKDRFNLPHTPESLMAIKRGYFDHLFEADESFDLIPGVLNLIQDYHHHKLNLVLASSSSMRSIKRIFDRFGLHDYFKATISGAELKASKPHPEIFMKAAKAANSEAHECMVIEDATNGVEAAKAAAIFCVAYDSKHSKNQDYSKADLIISDFDEIKYERIASRFED